MPTPSPQPQMHPRNPHQSSYDFPLLVQAVPALESFARLGPKGQTTIDFADPRAVKALNQALLKVYYRIDWWDLPEGALCPPIPGRADYIHHAADLIDGRPQARVLDIGVGANCVYPLIGQRAYGWSFVGSDINPDSLRWAQGIIDKNPGLAQTIELRLQPSPACVFANIIQPGEYYDLSLCNPPFHDSAQAARDSHSRRLEKMGLNLGRDRPRGKQRDRPLNFGGSGAELWCPGGESVFLRAMVAESRQFAAQVGWFTSLVSKRENLPALYRQLKQARATHTKTVTMAQGQKTSRLVAWRFS